MKAIITIILEVQWIGPTFTGGTKFDVRIGPMGPKLSLKKLVLGPIFGGTKISVTALLARFRAGQSGSPKVACNGNVTLSHVNHLVLARNGIPEIGNEDCARNSIKRAFLEPGSRNACMSSSSSIFPN